MWTAHLLEEVNTKRSSVKNTFSHHSVHWKYICTALFPATTWKSSIGDCNTPLLSWIHLTFCINVSLMYFIGSFIYFLIQHSHKECLWCAPDSASLFGTMLRNWRRTGTSGRKWCVMLAPLHEQEEPQRGKRPADQVTNPGRKASLMTGMRRVGHVVTEGRWSDRGS